jgi:hypothetical protein
MNLEQKKSVEELPTQVISSHEAVNIALSESGELLPHKRKI